MDKFANETAMANQATWWPKKKTMSQDLIDDKQFPIARVSKDGYRDTITIKLATKVCVPMRC